MCQVQAPNIEATSMGALQGNQSNQFPAETLRSRGVQVSVFALLLAQVQMAYCKCAGR